MQDEMLIKMRGSKTVLLLIGAGDKSGSRELPGDVIIR